MSNPKKRRVITLQLKKEVIEATGSLADLSKHFNLPRSTVKNILDSKAAILSAIDEGGEAKRSRLTAVKHEDLEEAVLRWCKMVRSQNVPLSGPLVMEKALELAAHLNIEGFKASLGWLEKFKHRHSINFGKEQGEAGDIDMTALGNWQQTILLKTVSKYSPNDVFNADETGLFWQLLPNKTLKFKGERCTSGKKSKQRITVLVGSNMSGTEKLPLLVIGKSANPRCFKNVQPPVTYKANKKAWMTADLFETWLKEWDRKLKRQNRKVLLFLDNFSGHSKIKLDQIKIKFLPPNTTAESQPMDQGIIENLKVHYRRFLLRERISAIDEDRQYKINILHALQYLRRSWDAVKPETLSRCFRKAGFVSDEQPANEEEEENILGEMDRLWAELQANDNLEGELADYLSVDEQVATGGALTLAEIAEDVLGTEVEEADEESETDVVEIEEEEPGLPKLTLREANEAMKILQRYVEQNTIDPKVLRMTCQTTI